jgi:hypothetical protein
MSQAAEFAERGFARFAFDERLAAWARHAASVAASSLNDPTHQKWWRHGRTWFVGVDVLPNDGNGQLPGGPPLAGEAIAFARATFGFGGPWHRGQLSVCLPGYPRRDPAESEAQHRFRLRRDAAHVDGLHAEGAQRRRHFREAHAFILGIPLNATAEGASPLVVWEGSHVIMAEMFARHLAGVPATRVAEVDLTIPYQRARARCFDQCRRTFVHAQPGEAYIVHRYALHGVAPWGGAAAPGASRMIAYFRPAVLSPIAIGR